jgi:hypothetical protein
MHVLAQPALADTRQSGDLPLSHAVRAEYLDHDAEVTMAAGIQRVGARADALDNFTHVKDG